ncbi:DUF4179 domain-containing protein [Paenibacillus pinisoli]|uniref:DUF4179 domain-containing protein n=1 Tax=Paenibacillus pinisoli TaxID=1276110 RepID=A0A3A6PLQ3_9BACL|nr:DUF4179 domain-containing protein [Paenibacillus pinisoli]RJX40288.1 DUF4179 domain-containing protein [Paenibacillus pinisoli]
MNNIEDRLLEERVRLSELSVPEELEARLIKALNTAIPRRKTKWNVIRSWAIAAAILAFMLVAGNQYHVLAYYGKMLLGFEKAVYNTLSELDKQGKGQALNERFQLVDGTMLTINGLMSDENQFILYYTLSNPNGLRSYDGFDPIGITGFQTDSDFILSGATTGPTGGVTETKGYVAFNAVSPLAKKLTLSYWYKLPESDQRRVGQVTFPYRPDEALPTKIKQSVNVTLNDQTITIGTITATPTMTIIKGTLDLENDQLKQAVLKGIELIANGDSVYMTGKSWQWTTGAFSMEYEALPEDLQSLQLILKKTGETVQIPVK